MMNLLIVEDNDLERNALENYIDWDILNIRIVDTAYNGQDGLEKTKLHKPDIVISDVKMPVMDGIEMAKAINRIYPDIKFIFSSGYDDVALLKEALEIRAYGYMIKPVNPEELVIAVKKTVSVLIDEKLASKETSKIKEEYIDNLPLLQGKFLEDLVSKERNIGELSKLFSQANNLKLRISGNYKLALMDLDFDNTDIFNISCKINIIISQMKNNLGNENVAILKFEHNKIVLIIHSLVEGMDKITQIIRSLHDKIGFLAVEHQFRYVIGLSGTAPNLTDLYSLFKQCSMAVNKKMEMGYGCVIQFEESDIRFAAALVSHKDEIREAIKRISSKAYEGENVEDEIDNLVLILSKSPNLLINNVQSTFIGLFSYLSNYLANLGENFEKIAEDELSIFNCIINYKTIPDIILYSNKILKTLSACIGRRKISKEDHIVGNILHILDNEYRRPITLAYLSDRVYLSSNYLRILFKEKMSISIQDYLSNIRIVKAKELLKQSRYKIQEIGEMVGYENSTYFNIVFKNAVNLAPGEYRNKFAMNEADKLVEIKGDIN